VVAPPFVFLREEEDVAKEAVEEDLEVVDFLERGAEEEEEEEEEEMERGLEVTRRSLTRAAIELASAWGSVDTLSFLAGGSASASTSQFAFALFSLSSYVPRVIFFETFGFVDSLVVLFVFSASTFVVVDFVAALVVIVAVEVEMGSRIVVGALMV